MSHYLLSCSCGQQTPVSVSQAGETVRCVCGAQLEVPTLRRLKELPPAQLSSAAARGKSGETSWEDRHRVAFLLVMLALAAVGVAGYLAWTMPASAVPVVTSEPESLDTKNAEELLKLFEELQKGIVISQAAPTPDQITRMTMRWSIGIALGLAVAAASGAVIALNLGRVRRRVPAARN